VSGRDDGHDGRISFRISSWWIQFSGASGL